MLQPEPPENVLDLRELLLGMSGQRTPEPEDTSKSAVEENLGAVHKSTVSTPEPTREPHVPGLMEVPTAPPTAFNRTDVGNGELLVARHGQDLRYVHPWGRWLVWDGYRFANDDSGEAVRRMKETFRWFAANANEVADEKERRALLKFALDSERDARVRAGLAMAQSEPGVPLQPDDLDADPWAFNVLNGTIDLQTGKLRRHSRADLITTVATVTYDPDATCPMWESALMTWLASDTTVIEYVRRLVGYSLTGSTREQVLAILYGPGENGKSTFQRILLELLGDYAQQAPTSTFLERRGDAIPNDLARLRSARLVMAAETGESRRLNEALVKQMTGGDRISARFMRAEWFEFTPQFTPWLATNHKPEIRGTDHAIWRRIRLIPFTVTIAPEKRDNDLADKLLSELEGILTWAVQGCLDWQRDGLGTSAAVEQATADYRTEQDVVGRFLDDRCIVDPHATVTAAELYGTYGYWCSANGEESLSQQAFGRRLADRGLTARKGTGGKRQWTGVTLVRISEEEWQ